MTVPSSTPLHLVLGGTGGVGRAVATALAGRGHRVVAVSRHVPTVPLPAGVEHRAGDVTAHPDEAVRGAAVVHHCAQPAYHRWSEEFPAMTDAIADATARAGARLVLTDNLYMYDPADSPLREDTPERATGRKGVLRARMARGLLERHARGDLRVAIGRLSDYHGPRAGGSVLGALVFEPAATGKIPRWPGRLDAPHTLAYLPDVGRALAVLGERPDADGSVWHLPAAPPVTGRELLALLARAAGREPGKPATMSALTMRVGALFNRQARESVEVMPQWTQPFVVDASRYLAAFGDPGTTPHDVAVRTTYGWYAGDRAGRAVG